MSLSSSIESSESSDDSASTTPLCPVTSIFCPPSTTTTTTDPADESLPTMSVCVTNVHGRSVVIQCTSHWTVEKLKKDYAARYSTTWNWWYMMYNGKCLQNPNKLSDYQIKDGSTIYVTCRQAQQLKRPIELYITDMADSSIVLIYADLEWTVQRVKKEYAQQKGNEHLTCRLYARGCAMEEKRVLAEYRISDEVVIHSVLSNTPATQVGIQSLKKYIFRKRSCKFL